MGKATGAAALQLYQKFWMYPAAFALVILIFFVLLFRDDSKELPAAESRGFDVDQKA